MEAGGDHDYAAFNMLERLKIYLETISDFCEIALNFCRVRFGLLGFLSVKASKADDDVLDFLFSVVVGTLKTTNHVMS